MSENDVIKLSQDIAEAIKSRRREPKPYDTRGIVKGIQNGVAYVQFQGGEDETPVALTIDAEVGDEVMVRSSGGRAYMIGNATAPPTDDKKANQALEQTELIKKSLLKVNELVADKATIEDLNAMSIVVGDVSAIANNTLIYDHTYEIDTDTSTATFTAYLYRGGVDIKSSCDPENFTWYYKTEDNEEAQPLNNNLVDGVYVNWGYTISVELNDMGYGGHIIGRYYTNEDATLLTDDDDTITTSDDLPITGRTESGESVRVSDLTVVTTLYASDKLMVIGSEDEHLITIQTLQDYLSANIASHVLFNTTAAWNAQAGLQSESDTLYIYTDHDTDSNGNLIAGIKVGDGNAYLIDMPFTDTAIMERLNNHISDTTMHITAAERVFWNNKVSCYYNGSEAVIFTTS